jgi:class 3 adenylate cyclase
MTGMTDRPPSKLAAILALDVADYSRLMRADEAATLVRLKEHRAGFWSPEIARHGGRVVGSAGDGLLAEFPSGRCRRLRALHAARNGATRGWPAGGAMNAAPHRHQCRRDRPRRPEVYGDSVNVAARHEGIATPGGVTLSDKEHREVSGKVAAAFEDGGRQRLKQISEPVHVWQWRQGDAEKTAGPVLLHEKPSVVVLPFVNVPDDRQQEYFADGITEEITTGLSRIRSLFVIARNSAFTYKGRQVDVRQIGRELGCATFWRGASAGPAVG